ncbi:MAG: hypothetical protein HY040_01280 [Planctomycetes bacterium]|nr:hypothetical protein [Planctomycetota bacterium]
MYERFTDRARQVLQEANEEAKRFRHEYIGTEHVLLGLVKTNAGVASEVLKSLGVELRRIRQEVEKIVQPGPYKVEVDKLPQTPRAKKVIEFAIDESRSLNHNYVGTEHILLGLIREQEGVASQVLMNLGLNLQKIRDEVLVLLGREPTPLPQPEPIESPPDLPSRFDQAYWLLQSASEALGHLKVGAVSEQDFAWAAALREKQVALKKIQDWLLAEKNRDA